MPVFRTSFASSSWNAVQDRDRDPLRTIINAPGLPIDTASTMPWDERTPTFIGNIHHNVFTRDLLFNKYDSHLYNPSAVTGEYWHLGLYNKSFI